MKRFIGIITICIFLLLVLRLCIVGVVYVQSNSMQPLISKNEGIIVDQLAFGLNLPWLDRPLFAWRSPSHGDIVVFENPHDQGKLWLKRVIGLPGDTLYFHDHRLLLNGEAIGDFNEKLETMKTPLGNSRSFRTWTSWLEEDWGPVVVPKESIFLMGDHRGSSLDSRVWGSISVEYLQGRAVLRFWPLNKFELLTDR